MTRILIYGVEPTVLKRIEAALHQAGDFEVLPIPATLGELMDQAGRRTPELLLMDLTPEVTFAALSEIRRTMGETKIVLWVHSISSELAFQAMALGIRGVLRKALPTELQVKCLRRVQSGELWFEKALTAGFASGRRANLTERESQLLNLLTQGLKNREIGAALRVSDGTLRVYLSRLLRKVGVKDRFELALFGLRRLSGGQPFAGISFAPDRKMDDVTRPRTAILSAMT